MPRGRRWARQRSRQASCCSTVRSCWKPPNGQMIVAKRRPRSNDVMSAASSRDAIAHLRWLRLKLGATALEHLGGEVESGDLKAGPRQRKQHTAGPAAELEDGAAARGSSHRLPETGVVAIGVDGVVDRRELGGVEGDVVVHGASRFARGTRPAADATRSTGEAARERLPPKTVASGPSRYHLVTIGGRSRLRAEAHGYLARSARATTKPLAPRR